MSDILAQSFEDWELLISDDGSSDGTREWLAENVKDPRIRVFLQTENLGYVRNKNFVFSRSCGQFLTQQDQDDRSHPERLERQLRAVNRTGFKLVGCGYRRLNSDGRVLATVGPAVEAVIHRHDQRPYPFWFPAVMCKREVYEKVGPFQTFFNGIYGDDLYWTIRANEHFPILCLPDILYDYVDAPASITSLLDNPRKLVAGRVLEELLAQRRATGRDWLDDENQSALEHYENGLMADRSFMSTQYRVYAARSIDQLRFSEAIRLLGMAFKSDPFEVGILRTILYLIRKVLRSSFRRLDLTKAFR